MHPVLCYLVLDCVWTFCVAVILFYSNSGLCFLFRFVSWSFYGAISQPPYFRRVFFSLPNDRSLYLSGTEEEFSSGRSLPFINPSSLETLRALVHEIQSSETDPEIWKNCEVLRDRLALLFCLFGDLDTVSYSGFWVII